MRSSSADPLDAGPASILLHRALARNLRIAASHRAMADERSQRGPVPPILLVEDSVKLRDAMVRLLEAEGYAVATAIDGEDALEQLRSGLRPCLILLDLVMPRKDGLQFRTEQMRDGQLAAIPTVACSADGRLREKAESLGLAFYHKPLDLRRMLEAVAQHSARARRACASTR